MASEGEMGEVDDLFGLSVGEMKFDDGAVASAAEDLDRLAIPGEDGPTVKAGAELGPLLGLKIENEKASLVTGEAGDVAAIGGPSWRIESLRSRESAELVCGQVENADDGRFVSRGAAENNFGAVGGPVGIPLGIGIIGKKELRSAAIR